MFSLSFHQKHLMMQLSEEKVDKRSQRYDLMMNL